MSSFDKDFYPAKYGAFESAYSKAEESGAMGCGVAPKCSQTKWITEKQKKFPFFHQKQVPNMECVLKHDAYKACLASAGSALPDSDPGNVDPGTDDEETTPTPKKKTVVFSPDASGFKLTTPMIIGIVVLLIVFIIATILIVRALRSPTPVATA